jgi:hypothetical protein
MQTSPIVPYFTLSVSMMIFLIGMVMMMDSEPAFDGKSYEGGIAYVRSRSDDPEAFASFLVDSCKYYVSDGSASAEGYTASDSFVAGCYAATGG